MPQQVIFMVKEMEHCHGYGKMLVFAALLIALGVIAGSYLLAQVDYSPKVNVSDITSTPNIYVSSQPPEHVISVSATASEKITPDLLMLQLRVQTESKDAKTSEERNAEVMEDLRAELSSLGVPEDEIQTSSFRVEIVRRSIQKCDESGCYYDYVIVGYRTIHSLTLSLKEMEKGGEIIDSVTGVGNNETFIDYIDFTLQPETRRDLEKQLLEDASEEAKEKAENIAAGLGVTLGNPVSASESFSYPYYYNQYKGYDMAYGVAEAAPTVLSPGEVEASATVHVGFEIA